MNIRAKSAGAGRAQLDYGLDFSFAERKRVTTAGTAIKFRGTYPSTMGYYHATYGGIKLTGNLLATTAVGDDAGKTHARILHVEGFAIGASECAAGVLRVELDRTATYPFGTTGTGGWGGAEDTGARIRVYQRAANVDKGGAKGLEVYVRQYSGGQIANLKGADISVDDRGSGGSYSIGSAIYGLLVTMRGNGVVQASATSHALIVEDTGQGTISPTNYNNSLLHIRTAGGAARASGAVPVGISFEKMSGSSGITAMFGCKSTDGGEGLTAYAGTIAGSGNCVRFTFNVNGTPYYFIGYATVDH